RLLWGLGSTLVGSIGILFSVTYFDQMHVVWYFLLACIAGATSFALKKASRLDAPDRSGAHPLHGLSARRRVGSPVSPVAPVRCVAVPLMNANRARGIKNFETRGDSLAVLKSDLGFSRTHFKIGVDRSRTFIR